VLPVPATPEPAMPAPRELPPPDGRVRPTRRFQRASAGTVIAVLAAVLLWAMLGSALRTGSSAPTASPSASEVPSASPTEAPPSSAVPPPTPTVVGRALAALDEVDAAIRDSEGRGGLQGKERKELDKRADEVRSALVDGELDKARQKAKDLADKVSELGRRGDDDDNENRLQRLEEAVNALIDILGSSD
jgi:type IV secretory pathway VirB10-like protein